MNLYDKETLLVSILNDEEVGISIAECVRVVRTMVPWFDDTDAEKLVRKCVLDAGSTPNKNVRTYDGGKEWVSTDICYDIREGVRKEYERHLHVVIHHVDSVLESKNGVSMPTALIDELVRLFTLAVFYAPEMVVSKLTTNTYN